MNPSDLRDPVPYSGAMRLIFIVGDPVAQVRSPQVLSQWFRQRGHDLLRGSSAGAGPPSGLRPESGCRWLRRASADRPGWEIAAMEARPAIVERLLALA